MFKKIFSIALAAGMVLSMCTIAFADTLELTDNSSEYSFVIADTKQKIYAEEDAKLGLVNMVTAGTTLTFVPKVAGMSLTVSAEAANGDMLEVGALLKNGSLAMAGAPDFITGQQYTYTFKANTVCDIMVYQQDSKWTRFTFSTIGQPKSGGQTDSKTDTKIDAKAEDKATTAAVAPTDPIALSGSNTTYIVRSGDTFGKMCLNFYGDMQYHKELYAYNAATMKKSGGKLYVGQQLAIPSEIVKGVFAMELPTATTYEKLYTVKAGDTLGSIAAAELGQVNRYNEIFSLNAGRIKDANIIFEGQIIVLPTK